jgi:preprotein translocase subunit SecB
MENKNLLYKPSEFPFKNFFHYLKGSKIEHFGLPIMFFNHEANDVIENTPEVAFEINSSPMDENVFKTNFNLKIKLVLKCKDKESGEEKSYHIYNLDMEFEAFTHIEDAKNVPDVERKKILMVDVAYLVFPFIRHNVLVTTESMKSIPVQLNIINFEKLLESQLNCVLKAENENQESKPANS